jgi:hypothetical protein
MTGRLLRLLACAAVLQTGARVETVDTEYDASRLRRIRGATAAR